MVHPLTTVTAVRAGDDGGYEVTREVTKASGRAAARPARFTAEQVVFAGARSAPSELLHRMRDEGDLPRLSDRLGDLTRTNSEAILGAIAPDRSVDYTTGVAITSSLPPRRAHPHRAGALRQGQQRDGAAADRAHRRRRPEPALAHLAAGDVDERRNVADLYDVRHWSERTVIALVMQTLDNSITTFTKTEPRRPGGRYLSSRQGHGSPTRPGSRPPTRPSACSPTRSAAPPAARSASRSTCR